MARQSSWSKSNYIAINDKVGSTSMPIEGAEAPRSFAEGTGKRRYDKKDPSVAIMRQNRAKQYKQSGIGVPGSSTTITGALTKEEMRRQKPNRFKAKKIATAKPEKKVVFMKPVVVPEMINPYEIFREREREKIRQLTQRKLEKQTRKLAKRREDKKTL